MPLRGSEPVNAENGSGILCAEAVLQRRDTARAMFSRSLLAGLTDMERERHAVLWMGRRFPRPEGAHPSVDARAGVEQTIGAHALGHGAMRRARQWFEELRDPPEDAGLPPGGKGALPKNSGLGIRTLRRTQ